MITDGLEVSFQLYRVGLVPKPSKCLQSYPRRPDQADAIEHFTGLTRGSSGGY